MTKTADIAGRELCLLAAGALAAAWLAAVVLAETSDGTNLLETASRPALYYLAHGAGIAAAILAGLLALLQGRVVLVSTETRLAFCVIAAGSVVWALAAYEPAELMSSRVLGATGPFVWLSLVFVFAGTHRRIWTLVEPLISVLAYLTSLAAVATLRGESAYVIGLSKGTQYASLLFWLTGFMLLRAAGERGWKLAAPAFPYVVLVAVAVHSQARSWTALSFLLGLAFLVLHARARGSVAAMLRTIAPLAAAALVAAMLLSMTTSVSDSIQALRDRLEEDTRSGQYVEFFADVAPSELILGRGPKGTWYWSVAGDFQFFDNGFLWTLFIGGVPIFFSYLLIVFGPAIRVAWRLPAGPDLAPLLLLMFWGLALAGLSTFTLPSLGLSSYLVSLCAGHCHRLAWEARQARFATAQPLIHSSTRLVAEGGLVSE